MNNKAVVSTDTHWNSFLYFQEVFHHEQKNVIFSPFSIKLLLSLLYEASKEHSKTRQELSLVLAGSDLEKNRLLYQEFLESSTVRWHFSIRLLCQSSWIFLFVFIVCQKENSNYQFNVGTRIFTDQRAANVSDAYSDLVQNCYKTSIESVEFDSPKETSSKINEWCFNITNGHLKDLVDEGFNITFDKN